MALKDLYIYGAGGFGQEIKMVIDQINAKKQMWNIVGFIDDGRERTDNVIDTDHDKEEIKKAIKKAMYDKKFINVVKKCKNPYGDGKTAGKIAKILSEIKLTLRLLKIRKRTKLTS